MPDTVVISRWRTGALWGTLLLYASSRVCQLYTDRLPTLLIVILHVIPPALFAIAHGSALYGSKGMSMFAVSSLGFGTLAESLSLRTAFPFGRYHFTDVMGPKVFQLPLLLALAYLGIGYVSWVLALLILGYDGKPIRKARVLALPVLAALVMTAWDLSMEPTWATLDRAWIWEEGGEFFGVPVSNFFGWFVTGYLYYRRLLCTAASFPCEFPRRDRAFGCRRFWSMPYVVWEIC